MQAQCQELEQQNGELKDEVAHLRDLVASMSAPSTTGGNTEQAVLRGQVYQLQRQVPPNPPSAAVLAHNCASLANQPQTRLLMADLAATHDYVTEAESAVRDVVVHMDRSKDSSSSSSVGGGGGDADSGRRQSRRITVPAGLRDHCHALIQRLGQAHKQANKHKAQALYCGADEPTTFGKVYGLAHAAVTAPCTCRREFGHMSKADTKIPSHGVTVGSSPQLRVDRVLAVDRSLAQLGECLCLATPGRTLWLLCTWLTCCGCCCCS